MAARVGSSTNSSVHCQTFPTQSITPTGLATQYDNQNAVALGGTAKPEVESGEALR